MSWLGRLAGRARALSAPMVLYTRRSCPLCDEMKAELERAGLPERGAWREVDVDSDPVLAARHGHTVPVLEIGGRTAFKARLRADRLERRVAELERIFQRRGPGPGAGVPGDEAPERAG